MSEVGNVLKRIIGDQSTPVIICTVDAVDKKARTVDCSPISEEAPLLGVNLQANQGAGYGFCLFPERGSYVAVATFRGNATGVVVLTEKIESAEIVIGHNSAVIDADGLRFNAGEISASIDKNALIFNGGQLGGLVKIRELTHKLNELVAAFNAHTHSGTCPTGTVTTLAPVTPAQGFNYTDFENTNVKH